MVAFMQNTATATTPAKKGKKPKPAERLVARQRLISREQASKGHSGVPMASRDDLPVYVRVDSEGEVLRRYAGAKWYSITPEEAHHLRKIDVGGTHAPTDARFRPRFDILTLSEFEAHKTRETKRMTGEAREAIDAAVERARQRALGDASLLSEDLTVHGGETNGDDQ